MRILVIEDERKLAAFIKKGLMQEGFSVETAATGEEGLHAAAGGCDLIILDLNLPDRDGLSVLKTLRQEGDVTPVLILTARDTVPDKVKGLEAGSNDYLTKPFAFEELVARVRVLLRPSQTPANVLNIGGLALDLLARHASREGRDIPLTNKEFALLEILMRNPGRTVSRTRLWEHAWDVSVELDSNALDVHMGNLRKKIDKGQPVQLIETVYGSGYRIIPPKKDK